MYAVEVPVRPQAAGLIRDGLRHVEIGAVLLLRQLQQGLVVDPDAVVVDVAALLVLFGADRQQGLEHHLRVGVVLPEAVDDLGVLVPEGLHLGPAQLIDAQHHVDLAAVLLRHSVQQRHLARRSLPGLFGEHGLHRGAHRVVIAARPQAAVQGEALGPGVSQEHHIVEICIRHRSALRHHHGRGSLRRRFLRFCIRLGVRLRLRLFRLVRRLGVCRRFRGLSRPAPWLHHPLHRGVRRHARRSRRRQQRRQHGHDSQNARQPCSLLRFFSLSRHLCSLLWPLCFLLLL